MRGTCFSHDDFLEGGSDRAGASRESSSEASVVEVCWSLDLASNSSWVSDGSSFFGGEDTTWVGGVSTIVSVSPVCRDNVSVIVGRMDDMSAVLIVFQRDDIIVNTSMVSICCDKVHSYTPSAWRPPATTSQSLKKREDLHDLEDILAFNHRNE